MMTSRYQAASVTRAGLVWMLGGRDGSEILMDNEILLYPAAFERNTFQQSSWEWAHKNIKNKEVWNSGVPEAMKRLPIPLTGHCVVDINTRYVLVIGGGTTLVDEKGNFIMNSEPEPTNHLHLYDFDKNVWHSTYDDDGTGKKHLTPMTLPRMNHACLKFVENGKIKIMLAGGVTKTSENAYELTNTAEVYDFDDSSWIFAADIPKFVTGSKLIEVSGRPTLVGRYGSERQCVMSLYTEKDVWTQLPINLIHGRSDFQLLSSLPRTVTVFPHMNSKFTKYNPGVCGTNNWRNVFGSIERGRKAIFRTNMQIHPWIQLDLGSELMVVIVSNKCHITIIMTCSDISGLF